SGTAARASFPAPGRSSSIRPPRHPLPAGGLAPSLKPSFSGMSETASAPLREAEPLHLLQPDIEHPAEHQLGDAVSPVKDERFISQVDQDHPHFPPVVGIDGPRTVQHRDSVF